MQITAISAGSKRLHCTHISSVLTNEVLFSALLIFACQNLSKGKTNIYIFYITSFPLLFLILDNVTWYKDEVTLLCLNQVRVKIFEIIQRDYESFLRLYVSYDKREMHFINIIKVKIHSLLRNVSLFQLLEFCLNFLSTKNVIGNIFKMLREWKI